MTLGKALLRLAKPLAGGRRPGLPVTRHVMYSTLRGVCAPYTGSIRRCQVISGSGRLAGWLGIPHEAMHEAAYPEVDVRALPYPNASFDAIGLRYLRVGAGRWSPTYRLAMLHQPKWPITTWVVALRAGATAPR